MFNRAPPPSGGQPTPGAYRPFGAHPYTPRAAGVVPVPAVPIPGANPDHLRRPGIGANSVPHGPASDYNYGSPSTAGLLPVPFTLDQQLRTVFIGKIPRSVDETWLSKNLVLIPDLTKWIRVRDGKGNLSRFGFAQFSTPESIGLGVHVLRSLDFPNPSPIKSDEQTGTERVKFSVHIQDNTQEIVDRSMKELQGDAKAAYDAKFTQTLASLNAAINKIGKEEDHQAEKNGELEKTVEEAEQLEKKEQEDGVPDDTNTFSVNAEDLNHIPAAQRELVAQEIANFRERSRKRDEEKLQMAHEFEQRTLEREKRARQKSVDIKARVPVQRDEFDISDGSDRHSDSSSNASEDEGVNDEILEEQAQERRQNDLLRQFHERESRWLKREDQRSHALERERTRDEQSDAKIAERRQDTIKELAAFDDRQDSIRRNCQFYYDRAGWAKSRQTVISRERHMDEEVQIAEERERKREAAAAAAKKEAQDAEPQRFKLSLGPAAKPSIESARRPTTDVEKLLEDEEDSTSTKKRVLVPLDYSNAKQELDEESKELLIRQLASEVPADREGLWNWPIDWSLLDDEILNGKLVPFISNKIVEYLGVQEQDLIDFVKNHIETHQNAESLQEEMQMALDEDAEIFVKRVWRMLVFELEFKKRALGS